MKINLDKKDIKDVFNFSKFIYLEKNNLSKYEFFKANYSQEIPKNLLPFNYAKSSKNINKKDYYIHFFVDDYQFERVYKEVDKWNKTLYQYQGIISPDFSLYLNLPKAYQIYQIYKKRFIEAYYSSLGIKVIPCITWSNFESLDYVLDGLENLKTIAVSTNGLRYDKKLQKEYVRILLYIIEYLKVENLLICGFDFEELTKVKEKVNVIFYDNYKQTSYKDIMKKKGL